MTGSEWDAGHPIDPAEAGEPSALVPSRFGCFLSPLHPIGQSPSRLLADDLSLTQWADELGLDEFWIGEHHSGGWGIIGSPEIFIAAAAQRTSRITLATGVVGAPYHNPFMVAERAVLLDHLTEGRFVLGLGAGSVPADMAMLGIDPRDTRRRLLESAEVIGALLRGEPVTRSTDWFCLDGARLQLDTFSRGIELVIASAATPFGMQLAGRLGAQALSHAAAPWGVVRPGISMGIERLPDQWTEFEKAAAEAGHPSDRAGWRVVVPLHVSTDRETALEQIYPGWERTRRELWMHNFAMPMSSQPTGARRAFEATLEQGGIIAGSPAECAQQIRGLAERTGGFGTLLIGCQDWASREQQRESLDLFARHVIPELRGQLGRLRSSGAFARETAQRLQNADQQAREVAMGQRADIR
ncbi:MAG: LLM class flavin-dependent oxidoreductase [Jatrophihabitantaceae bacterium]